MTLRLLALLVPAGLAGIEWAIFADQLPEKVASHFGPSGEADDWMSRSTFIGFHFALLAFFALLFVVGIPLLVDKLPAKFINIPHREYWLAPERKADTAARLAQRIYALALGLGIYFDGIMLVVIQANIPQTDPPNTLAMGAFMALVVTFLVFVGAWIFSLFRAFKRPATDAPAPR